MYLWYVRVYVSVAVSFNWNKKLPYSRVISFISAASLLGAALLLNPGYSILGILQPVRLNEWKLVNVVILINDAYRY